MHTYAKHASAMLAAALLFCLVTGVGWASRAIHLETGGRAVTLTAERLTFVVESSRVVCPVTLSGSFFSGLAKVEGVTPGKISEARIAEASCSGGSARLLTGTLPWWFEYNSFTGTLPRISTLSLGIEGLAALVEALGVGCLIAGKPRGSTGGGTEVREFRLDETVRIPVATRLSILCPSTATLAGTFGVSPTVRLTLSESLLGSTISASPNPLVIPAASPNGALTLTAVGGTVIVDRVTPAADPVRFAFTATGCAGSTILSGGTCTVTVAPVGGNRPTSGTVVIDYRDSNGVARQTAVTIVIQ